ncbi:MAG: flagellar assembly peptidoglycan hydrolase FlgJ [Betaproteobacteria bacterium]|nr:flagellar assembly peptidoglycan hydrolase FlgJ [Betaproteobacteria bacterium]
MLGAYDLSPSFAVDAQSIGQLKLAVKRDPKDALKLAARQFEALFVDMMLKSMRDATPHDGPLDSAQSNMYTDFLDQQLAQSLASGKGFGLAGLMLRQLTTGQAGTASGSQASAASGSQGGAVTGLGGAQGGLGAEADGPAAGATTSASRKAFVNTLWAPAQAAAQSLGVPPSFLIAHAALETGWGMHEPVGPDGQKSYNLFGIKAGPGWKGKVVHALTTEYVNGVPQKTVQAFRAYDSYAQAFQDYANVLRDNPGYAAALASGGNAQAFAQGLQRGGYATDPAYAAKLSRIIQSASFASALAA